MPAATIRVTGTVQGVGFRPTVWRIARECGLSGEVLNDGEGVLIHAWGAADAIDRLCKRLAAEPPPLARINSIDRGVMESAGAAPTEFLIVSSEAGEARTEIAADAATCDACLSEVQNPSDRRYRYPFTNCTHCGPRLSIIRAIPYDRAQTSMAVFPMCESCQTEYEDPADRRFHAQPNACPACGPAVWLEDSKGLRVDATGSQDAVAAAAELIQGGRVLAVKGIGGFHLACDASNAEAVAELRARKHRYQKALALMATDLAMVRRYCTVSDKEAELLQSPAAPVVVLSHTGEAMPDSVAPNQRTLGFMLPYSPLHHILMQDLDHPIVLTSGNRSDEPQVISNEDARHQLADIADYFLMHNRDIVNRLDDSVMRVCDGTVRYLRRARGFAPQPVKLPEFFDTSQTVLAMGGELKNTFCFLRGGEALVSPHIGDMEQAEAVRDYKDKINLFSQLFDIEPQVIAVDKHPQYLPTRTGYELAQFDSLPVVEVQHHHAHIAAGMVELGMDPDCEPVLGVALDGLGMGDDGDYWGGEFLLTSFQSCQRVGRFQPVAMPGGSQAMREPWRNTWAHLVTALGWDWVEARYSQLELMRYLRAKPVAVLQQMLNKQVNSPLASSCGRLFDAVAAAVGVSRERAAHEGQAAIELEALAAQSLKTEADHGYVAEISAETLLTLGWRSLWQGILRDLSEGIEPSRIAARFHIGLSDSIAEAVVILCRRHGFRQVVLSGGVFQNQVLLEAVSSRIRGAELAVHAPAELPANDGGLALGQAVVAAAKLIDEGTQTASDCISP